SVTPYIVLPPGSAGWSDHPPSHAFVTSWQRRNLAVLIDGSPLNAGYEKPASRAGAVGRPVRLVQLGATAEDLELDRDPREQRQHDPGGDHPNGGLHCSPPHEPDAFQQRADIADIEGGLLALEPDFLQGAASAGFGSANQERFKLSLGHTEVVAGFGWCHGGL